MADYTQDNRLAKITTPLGKDKLLLQTLKGVEELSRPFVYEAYCLSLAGDLDLDKVLGKEVTVEMQSSDGQSKRYFSAICTQASQVSATNIFSEYTLILEPWFKLLDCAENCKIFQNKTPGDIIRQIFSDAGFNDFKLSLSGSYEAMPYCVQYNETTFNFLSRLMENCGMYYFFKHTSGKHEMQIVDAMSAHSAGPGINWLEKIRAWSLKKQLHTCKTAVSSFDFKNPSGDLQAKKSQSRTHGYANLEKYHFFANSYFKSAQGSGLAQNLLDAQQVYYDCFESELLERMLAPGQTFTLKSCPRSDQNRDYLVLMQDFIIDTGDYVTQENNRDATRQPSFSSRIKGMPKAGVFRAAGITPRPVPAGLQSAVVVGKQGEEVWTDEFRRVKVQFPWDRVGQKDEKSSCWLRVAEVWAGKNFGAVFTPRVGQEVLVQFVDGNVDRPIIVGSVYNQDNKPPYGQDKATCNGVRTRSSKGGQTDNFNEIYFEDKKGEEKVYFQAEKDNEILVKNDRKKTIKHDEIFTVENDRTGTVKHDEKLTVENDRTRTVKHNETVTVENDRVKTVKHDEIFIIENNRSGTVKNNETHTVEKDRTKTVNGNETATIAKDRTHTVNGNDNTTVAKDRALNVTGGDTQKVTGDQSITVSKGRTSSITQTDKVSAQTIQLTGTQTITLKVGGSSIEISNTGIVLKSGASTLNLGSASATLESVSTTVKGQGSATLEATGSVKVSGSGMASLESSGITTVKGSVAMIN